MIDGPVRVTRPLLAVLEALLEAEGFELHGWAIMKQTGRAGPTVYKILERLAAAGWLTARWDEVTEPGRPRRRYYRLTDHGVKSVRTLAERPVRKGPNQLPLASGR
jgi:DNA-binding PadR family transcriptional regulator